MLKRCRDDKQIYMDDDEKYDAIAVTSEHWQLSSEDVEAATKAHQEQCPKLFNDAMKFE